jgi:preprotein translocase subunit SecE
MNSDWRRRILRTALFVIAVVLAAAFFTWTISAGILWLLEAMRRDRLP